MSVRCFTTKFRIGVKTKVRIYQQPNNHAAPERKKSWLSNKGYLRPVSVNLR